VLPDPRPLGDLLCEFVEQQLSFVQVSWVTPFSEPVGDLGEPLPGLFLLALLLPQACEARWRPQFAGLCVLSLGRLRSP
jgi:hypothetical protein